MSTAHKEITEVINGIPFGVQLNDDEDGGGNREVVLPLGTLATGWVKTDADTAACDVAAGSLIANGKVDVRWDVGIRYGVVCTRTVNALALEGGTGTDFPASAEDSCVVSQQVEIDFQVDGDNLVAIAAQADQEVHLDFQEGDDTSIYPISIAADSVWDWFLSSGIENELAGDPMGHIAASNGSVTADTTLVIAFSYDSTT
jgi:hypothetical protein